MVYRCFAMLAKAVHAVPNNALCIVRVLTAIWLGKTKLRGTEGTQTLTPIFATLMLPQKSENLKVPYLEKALEDWASRSHDEGIKDGGVSLSK